MRLVLILFSVLFWLSCNTKKPEPLDMNDILPSSEKYKEGETDKPKENPVFYFDSLHTFSQLVSDTLGMKRNSVQLSDSVLFPNRFIFKSQESWTGTNGQDEMLVSIWTYNDSLEMKNALFNWLDCFGRRCNSIRLYEEKKLSNESFLIYTTDRKMIYLSSNNSIDVQEKLGNLEKMLPREKVLYVLSQGLGRRTEWWEYVDKKWKVRRVKL
jgi:hypothetical protein